MQTMFKDGSVMICGSLPKDAEYKTVGDKNSSLTKFGVKVGERKVEGQDKPEAIWVNCDCWHEVAKATKDLKKFDVVFCIGKIKITEKDGKTYKTLECEAAFSMHKPEKADVEADAKTQITGNLNDFETIIDDNKLPF